MLTLADLALAYNYQWEERNISKEMLIAYLTKFSGQTSTATNIPHN